MIYNFYINLNLCKKNYFIFNNYNIFNRKIYNININNIFNFNKYLFLYKIKPKNNLEYISKIVKVNTKKLIYINNIKYPYLLNKKFIKIYKYNNLLLNLLELVYVNFLKNINIFKYIYIFNKFNISIIKYNVYINEFNCLSNNSFKYKNKYNGIFIYGKYNSDIISLYNGKILYYNNFNKKYYILVIKHVNNLISIYINSKKFLVKKNCFVLKKQKISTIGMNNKFYFEIIK
ncbi:M23 family metallopeptidase [endosymbiont of Pachyrhynchus infernalis]|uniref:M23 family metallopeptidase n=1 Tax=endosymbiont of Pachyrhynchus infernalis TaxID=1971488 RepID=UPI000DC6D2CA|nr:M23 family metallopeptidase [endosymbiont of Pachyrhynchus infernalis]BBA84816.1 lipoprotein NlpD [endosymbiont of Pachyrhynchus infernalis]